MPAPKDPEKRKEWLKNVSKAMKTKQKTKKHRLRISKAMSGRKLSDKHRTNISTGLTGYKQTEEHKDKNTGKNNYRWRGDTYRDTHGYVYIYIKKYQSKTRRSRYVAEQCLHRKLKCDEVVHHINEIKNDDNPENLYIFQNQSKHMRHHHLKIMPVLISNL